MPPEMTRLIRFGVTGALTTALAYAVFVGLIGLGVFYETACVASWAAGLFVGFTVNRRFTFGVSGAPRRGRDALFYLAGALLQLALGLGGYALLFGRLHLDKSPAFVINTAIAATFNFLFQRFVTFRRVSNVGAG